MRTTRSITCATAALAVLLAAAALPAEARTKRFRPLDFTAANTSSDYTRSPIAVGALSGIGSFTAKLGLPVGATITGIRVYSNGVAATRSVVVRKLRYLQPGTTMAEATEAAAHVDLVTPMLTVGTVATGPGNLVEPGYLYVVAASCAAGTAIWAVDVDYTP